MASIAPQGTSLTLLNATPTTSSWVGIGRGRFAWLVWGTWDGATATLQYSPDGTTAIDLDFLSSKTANGGAFDFPLPRGYIRVSISGAGGSTSLTSDVRLVA